MESLAPILTPKVMKFKSEFQQELQMGITGIWYMIDFRSASPTPCDSLLSQLFVSPWAIDNLHKFMLIAVNLCKWGWSLYNISSMTSMSKLNFVIREDRMKATAGFRLVTLEANYLFIKVYWLEISSLVHLYHPMLKLGSSVYYLHPIINSLLNDRAILFLCVHVYKDNVAVSE